jgi:MraZ protein
MLIGEYSIQIGDKNRVALPKKLRDELKGEIIMTRGYEKCLIMVDKVRWMDLISEINKNPLLNLNVRDTKRYLIGGAVEVEYDNQGRFVIPESLKEFSEIRDKVTFIGVGEWIEIWDESKWINKLKDLSENVSDIADRLSNK